MMRFTRLVRTGAIGVSLLAFAIFLGIAVPLAGLFAWHVLVRLTGGQPDPNGNFISVDFSAMSLRIAIVVVSAVGLIVGWRPVRRDRVPSGKEP